MAPLASESSPFPRQVTHLTACGLSRAAINTVGVHTDGIRVTSLIRLPLLSNREPFGALSSRLSPRPAMPVATQSITEHAAGLRGSRANLLTTPPKF
jgi:hypothetical protein